MADLRRRSREGGFTLVELVLALVVLAVAASVALGAYGRFARTAAVDRAAAVLAQDVQRARSYAVQRREPVSLVVDPDGLAYGIRPAGGPLLARQLLDDRSEFPLTAVNLQGADSLTFNARGLLTTGALQIDLARGESRRRVSVNALGRTRVTVP